MRLEDAHWLAKATMGDYFIDLIYGMGNGVALIDNHLAGPTAAWNSRRMSGPHLASRGAHLASLVHQ